MRIELGRMNRLCVTKSVDFGYYLDGGPIHEEILLPSGEVLPGVTLKAGDEVDAFLYLDQEERIIATMKRPLAQVGDFAHLEVAWVNNFGAFLHWGPLKDLFVPFREQKMKMQKGQKYIVHVHLDEESYRIMASAKVDRYLSQELPPYKRGERVEILVWQKTDLGLKAIVDNKYSGLLYDNQLFRPVHTGDRLTAFVSQVREDGKLDLMLQAPGQEAAQDFSQQLLEHLQRNGGFSPYGDKSPAEEIYAMFGVSKKVFKKAVGDLYRRRLITISDKGLKLV